MADDITPEHPEPMAAALAMTPPTDRDRLELVDLLQRRARALREWER